MIIVRAPRTTNGRTASVMRLRSSAGIVLSHNAFGTLPNIEPPSTRMYPSLREISSSSPERVPCSRGRVRPRRADTWVGPYRRVPRLLPTADCRLPTVSAPPARRGHSMGVNERHQAHLPRRAAAARR